MLVGEFELPRRNRLLMFVITLTYEAVELQAFSFRPYNRGMSHALVLNASFEPLHVVSWQRALQLLFQGKVEVVEESDHEVRTVRFTIKVPAVLRLLNYVPLKTKKQIVRFSRSNIFSRD